MNKLSIGSFKPRAPRELVCYPNVLAPRHVQDLWEKAHFLIAWCALSSKHINMLARVCGLVYASINVKPEEGGNPRAYVGHLTFRKNFWSKSPPWGPKIWSNRIKYPPPSNAWLSDEKRVDIINNPYNPHKERYSINLYWKWVMRSSVFV